jgi:hypothetical protein
MTPGGGRGALTSMAAIACVAATSLARAETHRVAAVDPDAQLTRALDVALSPWSASLVEVHTEPLGATVPTAIGRARSVARDTAADVVVWVSSTGDGHALWIYDTASDHASARQLDSSPPFDAATAAGVALAVKTLLRATVVAPPAERFGAPSTDGPWRIGTSIGASTRLGASLPTEGRLALNASFWPGLFGHRWGLSLDLESGYGLQIESAAFSGRVTDSSVRLGAEARMPIATWVDAELSIGTALHLVSLGGVVLDRVLSVSEQRLDATVDPRIAIDFALLHGRVRVAPWLGVTLWTRWQRFLVHGSPVAELSPVSTEGAFRVALVFP